MPQLKEEDIMLSIILTFCGIWALVTGKLPSAVFGGKNYRIEGAGARIIGAILILPFPLSFMLGFVLGVVMGKSAIGVAYFLEIGIFVGVLITALVVSRFVRQPIAAS